MFASGSNKENIQTEVLMNTPVRKPSSVLQRVAKSANQDGTPSGVVSKTPKKHSQGISTPVSHKNHTRRKSKRKSMPASVMSKTFSVLDEETLTRVRTGTQSQSILSKRLLDSQESESALLTESGQELNEMVRDKVLKTVNKMRQKYEDCLAEKELHLSQQCHVIASLKSELDKLKEEFGNNKHNTSEVYQVIEGMNSDQLCNYDDDNQVSVFVDHLLAKVVTELQQEAGSVKCVSSETSTIPPKYTGMSTTPLPERMSHATAMTPLQCANSETGMTPLRQMDIGTMVTPLRQVNTETHMTPLRHVDSETMMTPLQQVDTETMVTPLRQVDAETSRTPSQHVSTETTVTPVQQVTADTAMTPLQQVDTETDMTPMQQVDTETMVTPLQHVGTETTTTPLWQATTMDTAMIPVRQVDTEIMTTPLQHVTVETSITIDSGFNDDSRSKMMDPGPEVSEEFRVTLVTPKFEPSDTQINSDVLSSSMAVAFSSSQESTNIDYTEGVNQQIYNTSTSHEDVPACSVDVHASLTLVEHADAYTMVTPIHMSSKSMGTSPIVAALHPEVIKSLGPEVLRVELESLAISNELLRCECNELNRKVDELESVLADVRGTADQQCGVLQERADSLQKQLDKALEKNWHMEQNKPHSVEEYDKMICKLQKDFLLIEKQVAFSSKKASEADNLQKDLRRMYAKYSAEHQLYTSLDQEMKSLLEKHKVKCGEYEDVEKELCTLRMELAEAKATVEVQDVAAEQGRKSHVKFCLLEEQMEALQSQQKENVDFLEQERKGLEENASELEQLLKQRTSELDTTKQSLDLKTEEYECLRENEDSLKTQLSNVQDELNATQSQAHLLMLEQERELSTVSRVIGEAWELVLNMVNTYKKQDDEDKNISEDTSPVRKREEDGASPLLLRPTIPVGYKPSLVCQVLAAVSGTTQHAKVVEPELPPEEPENETTVYDSMAETAVREDRDSREFTPLERAMDFNQLVLELEEYASAEAVKEKNQMLIQQYVEEISNLENALEETRVQCDLEMDVLKEQVEHEQCVAKKLKRESEAKEEEMKRLRMEVGNVEQEFAACRKRTEEMSDRYCQLIEEETKNKELEETLRLLQNEHEKMKNEKMFLERELRETMEKLQETLQVNAKEDELARKSHVQQSLTDLLTRKLKLQREVEKLRDSHGRFNAEKEEFTQHSARLETKANILASNLVKAEEEIYRLDGIVDRFCTIAKDNREMAMHSQDLCDLLFELNVTLV